MPPSNDNELMRAYEWLFRCTQCLAETAIEPSCRVPKCERCDRYMAPVNGQRARA